MFSSMMTRFGVKNYKCLKDVDIPLTPIHVIIGQNDAGKTSLLEAMLAFFRSSHLKVQQAFPGKWQGSELVFEEASSPLVEFKGTFQTIESEKEMASEIEYGFQVDFSTSRAKSSEEWFCNVKDGEKYELEKQPHSYTRVAADTPGTTEIERHRLSLVKSCLQVADLYQFDPKIMAMPSAADPKRRFRMDADGFGLASLLDDILGYEAERFIKLRRQFCEYFPQFRTMRIVVEEAAARNYTETGTGETSSSSGKGIWFETHHGRTIRAQQASDGAILFLGFLALTFLPEPPKLILLEEPENGVYPQRLAEIVKLLRDVVAGAPDSSRPQVILSTHSPYLLSFFEPEEVTLMSRQLDGGVCARPLRDAPNIKERMAGEFYLGELWYNLSEEELFGGVHQIA